MAAMKNGTRQSGMERYTRTAVTVRDTPSEVPSANARTEIPDRAYFPSGKLERLTPGGSLVSGGVPLIETGRPGRQPGPRFRKTDSETSSNTLSEDADACSVVDIFLVATQLSRELFPACVKKRWKGKIKINKRTGMKVPSKCCP